MDTRSLALALIVVLVTQTVVGAVVASRRNDAAMTVWALGFGGSALGFLFLLLVRFGLAVPLTIAGNTLVASFQLLLPLGLAFFLEVPRAWRRYLQYLVVWFVVMVALTTFWPSYSLRSSLSSLFSVLMTVEFLILLGRKGQRIAPSLRRVLIVVATGFILFHGVRAVVVLFSQATSLMADTVLTGATLLFFLGFSILWGGTLLILDSARLQNQISSHNDELVRLNKLKDRVLAMTSHDLRGPLGNLQVLWGELAQRIKSGDCGELENDLFRMVDRSLVGTQSLLENLFSFADSQGTPQDPEARTDVSLAISAALDQCEASAMAKGVKLQREWEPRTFACARFEAVVTVLRNVLGNAVKFTPAGGSVTVRVGIPKGGRSVVLEVADTGVGMTAEQLNSSLLLESRVSRPGTAGERGSGFGLVLVKELVEGWGGSFDIESQPGQGAKVSISLPRDSQMESL